MLISIAAAQRPEEAHDSGETGGSSTYNRRDSPPGEPLAQDTYVTGSLLFGAIVNITCLHSTFTDISSICREYLHNVLTISSKPEPVDTSFGILLAMSIAKTVNVTMGTPVVKVNVNGS